MSPDQRRDAIVAAARPLLIEHGHACTTRLIAEAAGIAEGTVFRVFASKDEIIEAVLQRELDQGPFLAAVRAIDPGLRLEDRLVAAVRLLQHRFRSIALLLSALGMSRPPKPLGDHSTHLAHRQAGEQALVDLIGSDADRFRVPVEQAVLMLRLLTFSGTHPHLNESRPLGPEQIVDVVLHGTLKSKDS